MSEAIRKAIEEAQNELGAMMQKVNALKKAINQLCLVINEKPLYADDEIAGGVATTAIKADEYFGKGFTTAVKDFLRRKGGACSAKEIYAALQEGGFDFPENWGESKFKYLAISLSKNRQDFIPVKRGKDSYYGLWEFYPEKARERAKMRKSNEKKNGQNQENEMAQEASYEEETTDLLDNTEDGIPPDNESEGSDEK